MARSRAKSLRTLEKVRSASKQEAERRLAQSLQEYDAAKQMLETLKAYLQEYRTNSAAPVNHALTSFELESKRQFLDKLQFALEQQTSRLEILEKGLEHQRESWRHVYKDYKVVADLADRIDVEEMQKREKEAQKEMEDAFMAKRNIAKRQI